MKGDWSWSKQRSPQLGCFVNGWFFAFYPPIKVKGVGWVVAFWSTFFSMRFEFSFEGFTHHASCIMMHEPMWIAAIHANLFGNMINWEAHEFQRISLATNRYTLSILGGVLDWAQWMLEWMCYTHVKLSNFHSILERECEIITLF